MKVLQFVLIVLLSQSIGAQQPGTAFVQGVVTKVGDNEPLARASVELRSIDNGKARIFTTITPNDGKFSFANVPPGLYQLTPIRAGYVRGDYGQHGPGASGIRIALAADERITGVRLGMLGTGTIAGRITDREGEGIGRVHVKALRFAYQEGHRVLIDVKSVFTNDLGEYRLGWLPPGLYHVSATHPDGSVNPFNQPEILNSSTAGAATVVTNAGGFNGGSFGETGTKDPAVRSRLGLAAGLDYVPVYFPTTLDERSASVIDVRAGSEIVGANIVIAPTRTGSITGTVIDGVTRETWTTRPTIEVTRSPSYNLRTSTVSVDGAGSFSIRGLAPGSYVLIAAMRGDDRVSAPITVDVSEAEEENVQLTLEHALKISSRVIIEGRPATGIMRNLRINLITSPMIPGVANTPLATPTDDGSLTLTGVRPGDYIVSVAPIMNVATTLARVAQVLPGPGTAAETAGPTIPVSLQNAYVKSIRLGNTDLLNGKLHIDRAAPTTPLEIVIGTDAGQIDGFALDASQNAVANATVVLIPEIPKRQRLDLYNTSVTDRTGRFTFQNVPPGDYKVFAWEDVETGSWLDPQFMESEEVRGAPAHIGSGASVRGDVIVIPQR